MTISLLRVLEILLLGGGWTCLGHALLPRSLRRDPNRPAVWATALGLGAGLTAVTLTVFAMLHVFKRPAVLALAGATSLVALLELGTFLRSRKFSLTFAIENRDQRYAAVALAALLGLALLVTLAPPSSMDATVYHLRAPLEFLRTATWSRMEESQTFQPLYVEMLFGEGLVVGGGVLGALVHWALGLGSIAAAAAWGRRLGGGAIWGGVIMGATAMYVWESTSAFIDLGLGLFFSLACFWATREERDWRATVLAGVFAGLAAGSKFTGVVLAALAGLSGFAAVWPDWKRGMRRLVGIGSLAATIALPWYLRNWLLTGNPIYPLANPHFGLPPMVFSSVTYGIGRDVLHLLTSPIDLIARGDNFDQGWSVGPVYLAFIPLGFAWRRSRMAVIVIGGLVSWWLIWFYSSPQTRLLVPLMPMAAGLASVGVTATFASPSRALRLATRAILGVAFLGAFGTAALAARTNAKAALGFESPERFLERNSWNYRAYEDVNRLVPAGAKVAAVGVANNLYYADREASFLGHYPPPIGELRAAGFTHELWVAPCPPPPVDANRPVLAEGTYPLPASRLGGGIYLQVCYRLSTLAPPSSAPAP